MAYESTLVNHNSIAEASVRRDNMDTLHEKVTTDWRKFDICWHNVLFLIVHHVGAVYGLYLIFTEASWQTNVFAYFLYVSTSIGVTAGVHRLWSHKSYKAKLPLRIIILVFYTAAYQGSVHQWVRDHRVHHKHSDTDADPHNSKRGFFFSHMGWLMVRKHSLVKAKGKTIDISDLRDDPLLRFQHKYYFQLIFLLCYVLPTYIPTLWGENAWTAFFVTGIFRFLFTLHTTFLINSAAHMWGTKPYDKNIKPVECKTVSFLCTGEGFHNYHHTFPWDYSAAELGGYSLNFAKLFIDTMATIGWAYDLKTVSRDIIEKRIKTTGDGTHPKSGWDEKALSLKDRESSIILN